VVDDLATTGATLAGAAAALRAAGARRVEVAVLGAAPTALGPARASAATGWASAPTALGPPGARDPPAPAPAARKPPGSRGGRRGAQRSAAAASAPATGPSRSIRPTLP
jgi:hypothetical protein